METTYRREDSFKMKRAISRIPRAPGSRTKRQPQPPDEPTKPRPFQPPPEARPRERTTATGVHQLHTISVDATGPAVRTRPRSSKQAQEPSAGNPQPRLVITATKLEALPRQTPLSTNALEMPTTGRVPAACETNNEACATTGLRAAQTSTLLVVQPNAASAVTAKASTSRQPVLEAQEAPATAATTEANTGINDDGAPAKTTATTQRRHNNQFSRPAHEQPRPAHRSER
ncbi:PREDICTED: uncharacterized protein LOC108975760 isoform X2 [Bactrocera latifrons]|uniref:uncharacterized protein LOC108975760 isoform X2 n=1 Tax=Bactrocera latifrons TaxID=174628 RepID=UPI0008DE9DAF|nr:PREDICTED: uncharacterized protein LOC108975760 isoform X2 [Bactrocera latifrons]